jgi:hypothetical protein
MRQNNICGRIVALKLDLKVKQDRIDFPIRDSMIKIIHKSDPRFWAVIFSLIISCIIAWQFYINVDGIYYLKAAEDLLLHGKEAKHHGLSWPFFPLLIASLSYVSHLSLLNSAIIIEALLQIILVLAFINIIRALGGSLNLQWLAAAVILLHPQLNEYRGEIIRDFGYWGFLLSSFYYFIRYIQKPHWKYIIFWALLMVLATLFRIEGVMIIALTPLILLLLQQPWKQRFIHVLRFYSPWIVITLIIVGLLFIYNQNLSALGRLNELQKWFYYFINNFTQQWEMMQIGITPILPTLLKSFTGVFLTGGFLIYFLYVLLLTIQPLFVGLAILGQWKHSLQKIVSKNEQRILYGFLAINLLIPILILLVRWYITSRFVMPFALLVLLWVPFALYTLYELWQTSHFAKRYLWPARIGIALVVIALLIDGTYSYSSTGVVVKEAGLWVQTHVAKNETVFTNNPQLAFYANRPGMDLTAQNIDVPLSQGLQNNRWQQFDYLALVVKRKKQADHQLIEQTLKGQPIAHFENRRGDQVLIFAVCKKATTSRVTCSLS